MPDAKGTLDLPSSETLPGEHASAGFGRTLMSPGHSIGGRFEIRELAGIGGMGAVYRAKDQGSGRTVALKLLTGQQEQDVERFKREASVLALLEHPAIVGYVTHGISDEGMPYLVMEWLEGCDLASYLGSHRLTHRESVDLAAQVARALAVAHRHGIVHRDLNPRNLFLMHGRPSEVRVLDFGIALFSETNPRLTVTGLAMGTPGYMAPEQAQRSRAVTASADVFSLGCVLFECLTGERAFVGRTLMELLTKILLEDVPPPRFFSDAIPVELDQLVVSMLAKDPEQRPDNAARVVEALARLPSLSDVRPVRVSAAPTSLTTDEQRVLSVILSGELGSFVSPGDGAFDELSRATAAFGAQLQELANGCLVATVSGAGSATDQVVQAGRCALAIRQRFPWLSLAIGTGRGLVSGSWPVGQAIERAAQSLRPHQQVPSDSAPGAPIFVDEVTASLLDSRFEIRVDPAGLVLHRLRDPSQPSRTLLGVPTRLVGRNRELLTLELTYRDCQEGSMARAVLVTGPPGFGKTRLMQEFVNKLRVSEEPVEIWHAQGDPLAARSAFGLLGQAIRRAANIQQGEAPAVMQQKLRTRLARHVARKELQRVTQFLGELINAQFPDESSPQLRAARQDPVLRGDQMQRAFEDWLAAECAASAVVLILEDLQWGDLPTLKFLDSCLRQLCERPLLVLGLARPEVHDVFPGLWSRRGLVEVTLGELGRRASEALAREVLGASASEDVIERIVERASGNAFWLEELLRAEVEGAGHESSDTVVVMAQSRLEALGADARRMLRAGSVFGQRFWRGGTQALLGRCDGSWVDAILRELHEKEVIIPRTTSRFPAEREYEFRSGLFRDAAYATLTDEDRQLGHRLAARWLEDVGESEALTLAYHFDHGDNPTRAISYYLTASKQALEGGDLENAVARAERGIECGASGVEEGELRLVQAEASKWLGKNGQCQLYAVMALDCLAEGSARWCLAAGEAAVASGKLGDVVRYTPLAQSLLETQLTPENASALIVAQSRTSTQFVFSGAVELADKLLDKAEAAATTHVLESGLMGWVLEAQAVRAGTGHDPGARVELAQRAAKQFEQAGDLRNACLQQISLGFACVETGANADAEDALEKALAAAERLGVSNSLPIAKVHLGRAYERRGDLQGAERLQREAIEAFDEQSNQRLAGMARGYLARVLLLGKRSDEAVEVAQEAVEMLHSTVPWQRSALATLALARLAQGQAAEALRVAERAAEGLGPSDDVSVGESLVRLSHAKALHACGETARAALALQQAKARLMARADTISREARREAFLHGVPENAKTLELCRAWEIT